MFTLKLFQWFHAKNQEKRLKINKKCIFSIFENKLKPLGAHSTRKLVEIHNKRISFRFILSCKQHAYLLKVSWLGRMNSYFEEIHFHSLEHHDNPYAALVKNFNLVQMHILVHDHHWWYFKYILNLYNIPLFVLTRTLLSGIYIFPAMHSMLVTIIRTNFHIVKSAT